MNKTFKRFRYILAGFIGLSIFFFLLFEWTMSALVHSRKEVLVPDLKGKTLSEAVALISPLNLGVRKEGEEYNQHVPAGTIIRQQPLPGMNVREGKIVRITLSQGGEVTFVPELVGQPVRSAEIAVRSGGLSLGEESSRYSIVMEKGYVLAQDPVPGGIVEKDALINLVISAGPPPEGMILLPGFTGKPVEEARSWAGQNGVAVQVNEEAGPDLVTGTVLRQEPAPDSDITERKEFSVTVARQEGQSGSATPGRSFHYEVPQGGQNRQLRLVLIDEHGEREIFQGVRTPGTKLEIPVNPAGRAMVRVFINNILVEERELP